MPAREPARRRRPPSEAPRAATTSGTTRNRRNRRGCRGLRRGSPGWGTLKIGWRTTCATPPRRT
eukprot:6162372-Pyramimonas_sp.AAC.1